MREYSEPQVPSSQHPTIDLKKAPKWMKRPAGTVFGVSTDNIICFSYNGELLFRLMLYLDSLSCFSKKGSPTFYNLIVETIWTGVSFCGNGFLLIEKAVRPTENRKAYL